MNNKKAKAAAKSGPPLSDLAARLLSGDESVRTTLRMSKEAHEALSRVARRTNATKSKFLSGIPSFLQKLPKGQIGSIITLGRRMPDKPGQKWIRKTYVIKKKSLREAEEMAYELKISRDHFFSGVVFMIDLLLRENIDVYVELRDKVVDPIWELTEKGIEKIGERLGERHPAGEYLNSARGYIEEAWGVLNRYIEGGKKSN